MYSVRPRSDRMRCLQWEAPFLTCFLLAVSVLRAVYAPWAPRVFAGALWAPEVEKKATLSRKESDVIRVFFHCPIEWTERRAFRCGDESLLRKLLRKSGDCNDGGETFGVCRGLPGAVFFKVSANMTVYLTAKDKDFRALALNPLIRPTGQLIWWLPSNIKKCSTLF